MADKRLEGRVALVTGGGAGIGKATAQLLAQEGARVGVLDLDEKDTIKVADQINKKGGQALPLHADVSNAEQMEQAVAQLVQAYKRLDIVLANAGINGVWAPLEDLQPEEWDKTLETNLKGTFLTLKYSIPHLKQRGGSIIVTASINGTRKFTSAGASAYSSSKAGQVALAKMAALELARHRIRVNVICPGAIKTEIEQSTEKRDVEKIEVPVEFPEGSIPLTGGKPGKPEQVAQLVLFLASDASDLITGTEVWIDGAESLIMG